jgi:hypothetical protein
MWKPILQQMMVKGERVCGILLEYQKIQSRAILSAHYGTELMEVMEQATQQIKSDGGYWLRSALKRAESTGTRLNLLVVK